MHGRSVKLFAVGVFLLVLGAAAAGLGLLTDRPSAARQPDDALPSAPMSPPPVANRGALRQATNLSDAFIAIAEAVTPAVVRIQTEHTGVDDAGLGALFDFFRPRLDTLEDVPPLFTGGTGFVVSPDGYIVTNDHVVDGADRITVALADKRMFEAEIVGRDPTTDIAMIRIPARDLPALALGDSDSARVGEWVIAIGNPGFADESTLDFTVTSGIISAKGRPLNLIPQGFEYMDPAGATYAIEDFIQTDAVINPGNSGGPLVDLEGMVIGLNTAIASTTGFSQGYGFAIPANLVRRVIKDLVAYGHVRRPLLGVAIVDVTPESAEAYRLERIAGVVVEDFHEASPGRDAGLRRHDVITAVDGRPVERVGQLQRLIALNDPGQSVVLSISRWGEPREMRVRLGQAPVPELPETPRRPDADEDHPLGFEVADLDATAARRYAFQRPGGVVIASVQPYGPADRKRVVEGLRLVAIDRTEVRSAREARTLLRAIERGQVVTLLLEGPDGRTVIATLRHP